MKKNIIYPIQFSDKTENLKSNTKTEPKFIQDPKFGSRINLEPEFWFLNRFGSIFFGLVFGYLFQP